MLNFEYSGAEVTILNEGELLFKFSLYDMEQTIQGAYIKGYSKGYLAGRKYERNLNSEWAKHFYGE